VEDELAARGGGVDRLLQAAEADPALSQAGDGVDQMAQRAAQAVEFPDDQRRVVAKTVLVSMGGCITSALMGWSAVEVVGAVLGTVSTGAGRGVDTVATR
jgi:hypothetical protein